MAMIGGFDMSYKAWEQAGARYQVPNPEYDDWVQGIIIALQVSSIFELSNDSSSSLINTFLFTFCIFDV